MNSHEVLLLASGVWLGVLMMIAMQLTFSMVDAWRDRRAVEAVLRARAEDERGQA